MDINLTYLTAEMVWLNITIYHGFGTWTQREGLYIFDDKNYNYINLSKIIGEIN